VASFREQLSQSKLPIKSRTGNKNPKIRSLSVVTKAAGCRSIIEALWGSKLLLLVL